MTVTIRPVDVKTEQDLLLGVLEPNLGGVRHRLRFPWLYLANPAGAAWPWVVEDSEAHRAIGVAALFPRAVWIGERPGLCGQVGDFAIDAAYRSLGPAVMLQRATLDPVRRGALDLCYDCPPDERGMAPFRRLGISPTCQTERYARLLRCDRQLERRLGRHFVTSALTTAGNAALALRARRPPAAEIHVDIHPGDFGEEFSALDRRLARPGVIRNRRSADDLNWRYREHPFYSYDVVTARRRGELVGFAVLGGSGSDGLLMDLLGEPGPEVTLALLDAVADRARRGARQTLQLLVADTPALPELLRRAGFRFRSPGPQVVGYAAAGTDTQTLLSAPATWLLRQADILG